MEPVKLSSVCNSKLIDNIEDRSQKSKGDLDVTKYVIGATRQSNNILICKQPSSVKQGKEILNDTKTLKEKSIHLITIHFQTFCSQIFKGFVHLIQILIKFFSNKWVLNILMVAFAVSMEVFVVMVFAISTVLSSVLINLEDAYAEMRTFIEDIKEQKSETPSDISMSSDMSMPSSNNATINKPLMAQKKISNLENIYAESKTILAGIKEQKSKTPSDSSIMSFDMSMSSSNNAKINKPLAQKNISNLENYAEMKTILAGVKKQKTETPSDISMSSNMLFSDNAKISKPLPQKKNSNENVFNFSERKNKL